MLYFVVIYLFIESCLNPNSDRSPGESVITESTATVD